MGFQDSLEGITSKIKNGLSKSPGKSGGGSSRGSGVRRSANAGRDDIRPRTGSRAASGREKGSDVSDRPPWLEVLLRAGSYLAKTFATILLIMVITTCIVGATAMIYVLAFLDKSVSDIDLTQLKLNYTTTIFAYDSDQNMIKYETMHGTENREWVDYDEMPQYAKDAAVAVEDERFWSHHGVDWKSTTFAFANMFLGLSKNDRGGSTITQQLIKNVTKEDAHSVNRKLKEIFKALELEKKYTKPQVLEAYLNVIALGSGCNGLQTAAQTYFGKNAKELNLAESAAIVGITKYPSKYNPFYHPDENQKRQRYVLKKMYENGFITKEQYEEAREDDYLSRLNVAAKNQNSVTRYWSWYTEQIFTDVVKDLQKRNGLTESEARFQMYNGGFNIYANIDMDMQSKAEAIFKNKTGNNTNYWRKFPRSVQPQCAIAILNYNGEVKAIVGARGEKNANRIQNHASQSRRQPGSAIKPLSAYGLAVARIVRYLTPQVSYKFLTERLSIKLNEKDNNLAPMSVGALTDGVTVLEMASAYVMFGSGGIYYSPATYSLVTDQQGNTVLENTTARGVRVLDEDNASVMNRMLLAPVNGGSGTARTAKISGFDTFGKTGTTSDVKDRYFCGGTPYYVGACWFGYADNKRLEYTANYAMQAWTYVMRSIHKGLPAKRFSLSRNVVSRSYCTVSGGFASANCGSSATGYYSRNSSLPICPLHGGGAMTKSFTALLSDSSSFRTNVRTTESTTETESTTATEATSQKKTEKKTEKKTTATQEPVG